MTIPVFVSAPAEDAPPLTNLCLDHVLGLPARPRGEEGLGPGPGQDQTRKKQRFYA